MKECKYKRYVSDCEHYLITENLTEKTKTSLLIQSGNIFVVGVPMTFIEKKYMEYLLNIGKTKTEAAKIMGIGRASFYRKIKIYGIK